MPSKKHQSPIESNNAFMVKIEDLVREIVIQNSIPCYRIESRMEHHSEADGEHMYLPVIRIITYFEDTVGQISDIIRKEFDIEIEKSIDRKKVRIDSFSYKHVQYLAGLKANRRELTEYKRSGNKKFEIQVCSMLQDAWTGIEKELGYDNTTIPEETKRDFYRVGALLEMADIEFCKIRSLLANGNDLPDAIQKPETAETDESIEITERTNGASFSDNLNYAAKENAIPVFDQQAINHPPVFESPKPIFAEVAKQAPVAEVAHVPEEPSYINRVAYIPAYVPEAVPVVSDVQRNVFTPPVATELPRNVYSAPPVPQPVVNELPKNIYSVPPVPQPVVNELPKNSYSAPPVPQPIVNELPKNSYSAPPVPQPVVNELPKNIYSAPPVPQPVVNELPKNIYSAPPVPQPVVNELPKNSPPVVEAPKVIPAEPVQKAPSFNLFGAAGPALVPPVKSVPKPSYGLAPARVNAPIVDLSAPVVPSGNGIRSNIISFNPAAEIKNEISNVMTQVVPPAPPEPPVFRAAPIPPVAPFVPQVPTYVAPQAPVPPPTPIPSYSPPPAPVYVPMAELPKAEPVMAAPEPVREPVTLNSDILTSTSVFNSINNSIAEKAAEVSRETEKATERVVPFFEDVAPKAGKPSLLDENAPMNDATLREYVMTSKLLKEVDQKIAERAGAKINPEIDIEGDVDRLRFLKVFTLKQLHDRIADNKNDIVAFAEKWIGKDNGGSFDSGISLFYLEYLLVGKKNDPAFAIEYVVKFISDNDYSARYIIPTYNSIRNTEVSNFSHLTLKV